MQFTKLFFSDLSTNTDEECRNVSKCPVQCKCSHGNIEIISGNLVDILFPGVVDCRNIGLTKIPEDIPFDTVEL